MSRYAGWPLSTVIERMSRYAGWPLSSVSERTSNYNLSIKISLNSSIVRLVMGNSPMIVFNVVELENLAIILQLHHPPFWK